jgi:hypothetical protein
MEPQQLRSKTAGVVFGNASSPVDLAILNVSKARVFVPRCAKIRNDFGPVVDPDGKTYGSSVRSKSAAKAD